MASPSVMRAGRLVGAVGAAVVLSAGVLPTTHSHADPRPGAAAVQQAVGALQLKVDLAVEDYDAARVSLGAASARLTRTRRDVDRQREITAALRRQLGAMAAAAYRSSGTGDVVTLLLTGDPRDFLERAASLNQIAHGQDDQIRSFLAADRALSSAQAAARAAVRRAQTLERTMRSRRDTIVASLRDEQGMLARLQGGERAALQAREVAADRASRSTTRSMIASTLADLPASGRAAVAVRFAYAQLGKPYQWGATGPGSYDCSGLTMAAWAAAGVSLPHSSRAQFGSGQHIAQGALRPGDLVFYGSPIHHVGIYVGGGMKIAAPHTGDVVKMQSAFRGDFVGAVRP